MYSYGRNIPALNETTYGFIQKIKMCLYTINISMSRYRNFDYISKYVVDYKFQYNTIQVNTIQYSSIQSIQFDTIQYIQFTPRVRSHSLADR